MPEIRTREEALAAVDHAFAEWAGAAKGVLTQASVTVGGVRSAVAAEVTQRASRVAALSQLLASLGPDDGRRGAVAADLASAQASHQAAMLAATQVDGVAERLAALHRSHIRNAETQVSACRADLARRDGDIGSYRAAGESGSLAPVPSGGPGTDGGGTGGGGGAAGWLTSRGMVEFDVSQARFFAGPGSVGFPWHGVSRADFVWVAETWDRVVRPGLERGMTRDHFAARDQARGAEPGRRTADVYDVFLGTDRIRLDRQPDGTLLVGEGQHRVQIARELGISMLPGVVS